MHCWEYLTFGIGFEEAFVGCNELQSSIANPGEPFIFVLDAPSADDRGLTRVQSFRQPGHISEGVVEKVFEEMAGH